jgi:hypothetical protein
VSLIRAANQNVTVNRKKGQKTKSEDRIGLRFFHEPALAHRESVLT